MQHIRLTIGARRFAERALRGPHPFTHLVSITDPALGPLRLERSEHVLQTLRLSFHDVIDHDDPSMQPPAEGHIRELLAFAQQLRNPSPIDVELLVHCEAGISRSTAAAFILLTSLEGLGSEPMALARVLVAAKLARPNELMVRLADKLLKRGGAMEREVAARNEAWARRWRET